MTNQIGTPPGLMQRYLVPFVVDAKENCWKKGVVSAVSGIGIGLSLATFMGTFEGAHGQIVGKTTIEQLKNSTRKTIQATWWRTKALVPNFALVGGVWASLECVLEKHRGVHDLYNPAGAGLVAGALFGGLPRILLRQPMHDVCKFAAKGSIGFALFGIAIEWISHHEAVDEWIHKKRKEAQRHGV